MTKLEKQCKDFHDVNELAHVRTVADCRKKRIVLDCDGTHNCDDTDHEHGDKEDVRYTAKAQAIFDRHINRIEEVTGI